MRSFFRPVVPTAFLQAPPNTVFAASPSHSITLSMLWCPSLPPSQVINIGFLLSLDLELLYQDVCKVVQASAPVPVKVILESSLLKRRHLISACYVSCLAGAKFLKTSTGYALPPSDGGWGKAESNDKKPTSGAQKDDVRLMFEIARSRDWGYDYQVEIKASGGIRSLNVVREMWKNGATRVGASGTKKILEELQMEKDGKVSDGNTTIKSDAY